MGVGVAGALSVTQFGGCEPPPPPPTPAALLADAPFDYQIGQDYAPPAGTAVVSRDWFFGEPLTSGYSICYVNAFQTQSDDDGFDRPDELSNWPVDLVLFELGDDPAWGGEYLIDISTEQRRLGAALWLLPMIASCANDGFDAVEFDNLDSWMRFNGTPLETQVPFGEAEAVEFAGLITQLAHNLGLAVAQKNTVEIVSQAGAIGFDFAMVESCGLYIDDGYDECAEYAAVYGGNIVSIEYSDAGFAAACDSIGATSSVVRRDVLVTAPGSPTYIHDEC